MHQVKVNIFKTFLESQQFYSSNIDTSTVNAKKSIHAADSRVSTDSVDLKFVKVTFLNYN